MPLFYYYRRNRTATGGHAPAGEGANTPEKTAKSSKDGIARFPV
jgi:hypothetical protein